MKKEARESQYEKKEKRNREKEKKKNLKMFDDFKNFLLECRPLKWTRQKCFRGRILRIRLYFSENMRFLLVTWPNISKVLILRYLDTFTKSGQKETTEISTPEQIHDVFCPRQGSKNLNFYLENVKSLPLFPKPYRKIDFLGVFILFSVPHGRKFYYKSLFW